jgi:hypothetical protein
MRRPVLASPQSLRQKMPGCLGIAAVGQQEVDGSSVFVDGAKQPLPFATHPDTCLVDPPGAAGVALVPADLLLQPRCIVLNPTPDGRVNTQRKGTRRILVLYSLRLSHSSPVKLGPTVASENFIPQ